MSTNVQTYGITLPITHGPRGYFAQSHTLLDQVKSNLNLLLRTKKGERRMNSEFGSGLWNILFENYGDDIKPIIESTIRKDISRWMGYVNIKSVSIKPSEDTNIGRYTVGVSIVFTVPTVGINNPQTVDIEMNTNPL